MTVRIVEAPLNEQLLNQDGSLDRIWLRHISDSTEAIVGYWGDIKIGSPYSDDNTINTLTLNGNLANLYMKFDGIDSTTEEEFEIPSPYGVLDDVIQVVEYSAGSIVSISYILVEDSKFTLPIINTTNTVILKGNFRRNNYGN